MVTNMITAEEAFKISTDIKNMMAIISKNIQDSAEMGSVSTGMYVKGFNASFLDKVINTLTSNGFKVSLSLDREFLSISWDK